MKGATHQWLGFTTCDPLANYLPELLVRIRFKSHAHAEHNGRRTRYTAQQMRYKTSSVPRDTIQVHLILPSPLPLPISRLPPRIPPPIVHLPSPNHSTHSSPARTSFSKILTPSTKSSPNRTDFSFNISSNSSPVSSASLSLSLSLPPGTSSSLLSSPLG